jgi:hypothetical protein
MSVFRTLGWVALALAASACGNDYVPSVVNTGVAVLTYDAPGTDFGAYPTYAIVNKLAVIDDTTGVPKYTFQPAPEILGAVERNMKARGFVLVARIDPENPPAVPVVADLAINAGVFVGTDYAYVPCDYWGWWGYPGYGCDLPWEWVAYRVGTLLVEMGDLAHPQPGPVFPRLWAGAGYSVLTPQRAQNVQIAVGAVDQAFAQSPYLVVP